MFNDDTKNESWNYRPITTEDNRLQLCLKLMYIVIAIYLGSECELHGLDFEDMMAFKAHWVLSNIRNIALLIKLVARNDL
jgi:hypothetical protein